MSAPGVDLYLSFAHILRLGLGITKVNIVSALGVDYICAETYTVVNYDRGNVETAGFGAVPE